MKSLRNILLGLLLCIVSAQLSAQERADSAMVRYLQTEWHLPVAHNSEIVLLTTGREKFDDLFEAVRHARSSIHLEYFNFRNDSISTLLFNELRKKVEEGVEVRAIFDGFGNSSNDRPIRHERLDTLRAWGLQIHNFDPLRFPYIGHSFHRDHRKIVVIDGLVAYIGGMNVADYYINGKADVGEWRDMHCRITGDAVDELQGIFLNFWNRITHEEVQGTKYYTGGRNWKEHFPTLRTDASATAGRKPVLVVNRDPLLSRRIIHDTYLQAINGAQQQIQIVHPYFTLCRHLRRALKRAAKRGVDVQIMVSEKCDIPLTPRVVERNAKKMMKAGAKVYFYQGGFHHSKVMLIDSAYTFMGSANMNGRSLSFDYECNLLIADRPTTAQLQQIFEHDKETRCFLLTPERWRAIPLGRRIKGRLASALIPFI